MPHNARHIHSRIYTYVPNISLIYIILCETLIVKKVICSGSAVLPDVNNDINDTFGQDESEHEITKTPLGINTSDDDKKFVLEPIFVVNQTIEHHDNKTVKLDKEEFNRSAYKIENESVDNNDNNIIINININKSGGHNGDEKNNHTKYYTYYHGPRRLRDKAMAS